MNDLRQFERFPLTLPVKAEVYTSDKKQVFNLKVRDISVAGTFVYTPIPFPSGTIIKLNLVIPNGRIKQLTNAVSLIDCEGPVIRSTDEGVAIHFIMDCKIMSLTEV